MAISYRTFEEDGVVIATTVGMNVRLFNEATDKTIGINMLTAKDAFLINHQNGNDERNAANLFKRFLSGMVSCDRRGLFGFEDVPDGLIQTARAGITECVTHFAANDKEPYVIHYKEN
jgi:hypothetical protein